MGNIENTSWKPLKGLKEEMSDHAAQQPVDDMSNSKGADGTQEIVAAYEHQAEIQRAKAHAAEEKEQWEDYD